MLPRLALLMSLGLALPAAAETEALWPLLGQIVIDETGTETDWSVEKTFPDALLALDEPVSIEGYPVVILAEAEVSTFILVQDREDCPFCGSGNGYGPSLEVHLADPVRGVEPGVAYRVTGTLELIPDADTYQSYRMVDARLTPSS